MDVWVIDRDTGVRLWALTPDASSGWLRLVVREWLWQPDEVEVSADPAVARDAGLLRTETVDGGLVPAPTLLMLPSTGQVFALGPTMGSQHITVDEDGTLTAVVRGWDPCAQERRIDPRPSAHDIQSGPGETVMKQLVSNHLGPAAHADRRLPDLVVEPDLGRGGVDEWQPRFAPLVDYLAGVGMASGVGWRSVYDDGDVVFTTVHGADLSATVILEVGEMGTVAWEEILRDADGRATHAIVAGQGHQADREIIDVATAGAVGFRRSEVFVDARDVEDGQTDALAARGAVALGEAGPINVVEVALDEGPGFAYRTAFGMGDLLSWRSPWAARRTVRVVGVESVFEGSPTPERTVSLDRPWPDLGDSGLDLGGSAYE